MSEQQEDKITPQATEVECLDNTPEAVQDKPKHAGGRKPKSYYQRGVQDVINGSAPAAAIILDKHLNQVRGYKSIKDSVLKTCFYLIDHAIGKARQKVEHSGGILTYGEIAKGAEALNKKPRNILAEAMDIAHKHEQREPLAQNDTDSDEVKGEKNSPETGEDKPGV